MVESNKDKTMKKLYIFVCRFMIKLLVLLMRMILSTPTLHWLFKTNDDVS